MKEAKTKTLISILTAAIMLLIPIVALTADPPAPVPKTGQTTCYDDNGTQISCAGTGQDAEYQKGVASPNPRFTDNSDGTVTDHLTGLMWFKNANQNGKMTWNNALEHVNNLGLGSEGCGGTYTDWRLPNRFELESLFDLSNYQPSLPTGHPFTNVQFSYYWSSTTHVYYADSAWNVDLGKGYVSNNYKTAYGYVLPVRGGPAECIDGTTQPCGSDVGECQSGIQTCANGQWDVCEGETGPSPEVCDGVDNNCDAEVDEIEQPCGSDVGECQSGIQTCIDGQWDVCEGETGPSPEICDGVDNNCDTVVDENCDCINGATQPCGSDVGECQSGIQTCVDGQWDICEGETGPSPEICDGVDNNCDTVVDESCDCINGDTQPCGSDVGECQSGIQTCIDGQWDVCEGETGPSPEICDGVDNNCDTVVDENCDCINGATQPCGNDVGECQSGIQTCVDGQWDVCEGETGPSPEICDGVDNNCDGVVDEGYDCIDGTQQLCPQQNGVCSGSTRTCQNCSWGACNYNVFPDYQPTEISCSDNMDNDCDGYTDGADNDCG